MIIGLAGAHRTGKTTLGRLLVEREGFTLVASDASGVAKRTGFDMNADNSIADRVEYQAQVLRKWVSDFQEASRDNTLLVSDRTPLDMAAYLLCDVRATTGSQRERSQMERYVDECVFAARKMMDVIIAVPPGLPVAPHPDKPAVNPVFQMHHHYLVRGLMNDVDEYVRCGWLDEENLRLEDRYKAVLAFANDSSWLKETA